MATTTEPGFDLAVIGSGSAAFAAAIAATGLGARVAMVERGVIGGACVNVGCIPSKALLAAADARHAAHAAGRFPGLASVEVPLDFAGLMSGKDDLVRQLRAEKYTDLAAHHGWEMVHGDARFTGGARAPALAVTLGHGRTRDIKATHYLIATGSSPWIPAVEGLDQAGYLTSTTAMELDRLPKSIVVVGGNAVGLEQAQLFSRLGSDVTVIEALDRIAPFEEPEISAAATEVFEGDGIRIRAGMVLTKVRRDGSGYTLDTDGGAGDLEAEQLLMATGRRPVTAGLGLDAVGVHLGGRGQVIVDEHQRTTNHRIWAAGDITGGPQFVYVAANEGTAAAENALGGRERALDRATLPRVIFTSPAIAAVGMTEAQAVAAGHRCESRALPLEHVARAIANRDTRGLIKLNADADTGQLLGVHALAEGAGEVIAAATYAISARMTIDQLAHTWSPYLTMAESLKLAAQAFATDVTKLSCCAG